MARPVTARPPGEHLAVLTRVLRQIEADGGFSPKRKKMVLSALATAIRELTEEARKKRNGTPRAREEWA